MNSELLHRFLSVSRNLYYTNLFTLGCQVIAMITTLSFIKKESKAPVFFIYSCAAFSLFSVSDILLTLQEGGSFFPREATSIIFSFIEYFVFYRFFQTILVSSNIKKAMNFFLVLFTSTMIIFLLSGIINTLSNSIITVFADFLISSELFFLTGLCLFYYFESIHKKPTSELKSSPSFWIVTGLFFYSIIIAPFFMITDEIMKSNKKFYFIAYAVHYTSFGFLFLAITKAFLMRKPLTS